MNIKNPRFVWLIGSIREQFPDLIEAPLGFDLVLWDRQEKKPVVTVGKEYANAICLEKGDFAPFTKLESWFNALSKWYMESEGMVGTNSVFNSTICYTIRGGNGKYWTGMGVHQGFFAPGISGCYSYTLEQAREIRNRMGGTVVEVLDDPNKQYGSIEGDTVS
jgi:hypothetical protein